MIRLVVAFAAFALLGGCSSIPMGNANQPRQLDYLNDDLASLLIAFDLPPELEPVQGASTLSFDIRTPASGERRIVATLATADADELAGTLPPPSGDRNYYLFGFSDADKEAIRQAQAWARGLTLANATPSISLIPGLCRANPVDAATTTVSVLAALPGTGSLSPLIGNRPLAGVVATPLPNCAGHSG